MTDDDTPTVTMNVTLDKDDLEEVIRRVVREERAKSEDFRIDRRLR